MTARVVPDDADGRALAIEALRAGGVVAIPTDTVYGIGVSLATPGGIERLFHVKHRPLEKGIALLIGDVEQAGELGRADTGGARARGRPLAGRPDARARAATPGSRCQRHSPAAPPRSASGCRTIRPRAPSPARSDRCRSPRPTCPASPRPRTADEILALLGAEIDLILDGGPARGGPASTVVDVSGERPRIVREGAIPRSRLAEALAAAGLATDID